MLLEYSGDNNEIKNNILFINNLLDQNPELNVSNINSGIGDILLTKIYNNPKQIYYNIKHTLVYKPFPDNLKNVIFNIKLLYNLFTKENVKVFNKDIVVSRPILNLYLNVKEYSLMNYFNIKKSIYQNYIIIHTKIRLRKGEGHIVNKIKNFCKNLFKDIKFKYKVIILGERKIDENKETKIIDMNTIYDECLLLKNNNNVIDLTVEKMYNTPNFQKFEEDINLVNNAVCNIGFGHGGQFCINLAFSNSTIYYTSKNLIHFKIKKKNFKVYEDLNVFKYQIMTLC